MEKIKPLSYENNAGIEENEHKNTNDMIYIQTSEKVFKDFTSKDQKILIIHQSAIMKNKTKLKANLGSCAG